MTIFVLISNVTCVTVVKYSKIFTLSVHILKNKAKTTISNFVAKMENGHTCPSCSSIFLPNAQKIHNIYIYIYIYIFPECTLFYICGIWMNNVTK